MINPCYECPKYRAYGLYLDEVLISNNQLEKTILSKPERIPDKKPAKKAKPKPQTGTCKMKGCDRKQHAKGYCNACGKLRAYAKQHGKPIPKKLTDEIIKKRATSKVK